ncbi:MAG: hypothetical protein ACE15E_19510 [Acidobacteriota bacterium]
MSIPFGEANGVLVQLADYLVFVDEEQRESSFAVRRSDIRNLSAQDETVNVELNQPVSGRSGQMDRLAFRLEDRADVAALTAWGSRDTTVQQSASNTQPATSTSASSGILGTYQVKHNHRFGDCRGNLIIKNDGIAYESINQIDHSRQWAFRDIQELHHDNPYKLSIDPFAGNSYDFDFLGKGMDNNVFQAVAQKVTSARVAE